MSLPICSECQMVPAYCRCPAPPSVPSSLRRLSAADRDRIQEVLDELRELYPPKWVPAERVTGADVVAAAERICIEAS